MATIDDDEDLEYVLLNKSDAKVYPVPPATSASGHRAADWSDALKAVSVRVLGKGKTLTVKLLNRDSEKTLFVQCVIPNGEHEKWCERVVDSSRYWVMKVVKGERHAFLGFGFSDRNDAFDFSCCLNDFRGKFVDNDVADTQITSPLKDLSLKEGEKIAVNIPGLGARKRQETTTSGNNNSIGLLPPPSSSWKAPPSPVSTLVSPPIAATAVAAAIDDDFADFQSAPAQAAEFPPSEKLTTSL